MSLVLVRFHVRGLVPTIMHNGRLADPMNKWSRALKAAVAKKSKMTDEERINAFRIEFMGSLYTDKKGQPAWPGENIEAMIRGGARMSREGKNVEKGLQSDGYWPLIYDGPKNADELWELEHHRKISTVVVNKSRVQRCRPIFPEWELKFDVQYDPEHIENLATLRGWVEAAGRDLGLSDWRPKYGRFELLKVRKL